MKPSSKQTPGAFNRANTVTTISMNIPLPWFFSLPVVFLSVGPPAPPAVFPPRYSFDVNELTAHPVQVPPAATVSGACSASNKQFVLRRLTDKKGVRWRFRAQGFNCRYEYTFTLD